MFPRSQKESSVNTHLPAIIILTLLHQRQNMADCGIIFCWNLLFKELLPLSKTKVVNIFLFFHFFMFCPGIVKAKASNKIIVKANRFRRSRVPSSHQIPQVHSQYLSPFGSILLTNSKAWLVRRLWAVCYSLSISFVFILVVQVLYTCDLYLYTCTCDQQNMVCPKTIVCVILFV